MPRKAKKKGKKKDRKNAKRLLEEQERKERKAVLETQKIEIAREVAQHMSRNAQRLVEVNEQVQQHQEQKADVEESNCFLSRKLNHYEDEMRRLQIEVKQSTADVKQLEKNLASETERIEEHYKTILIQLNKSRERLMSKFDYLNLYKIMHTDLMASCLNKELNRADLNSQFKKEIEIFENHSIVEMSELREVANKQLDSFLNTAFECFEKLIGQRTQDAMRENILLNRQADLEFKQWIRCKHKEFQIGKDNAERLTRDDSRLEKHVGKLEGILKELKQVYEREVEESKSYLLPLTEKHFHIPSKADLTDEIRKTKQCDITLRLKVKDLKQKHEGVRIVLRGIFEYAKVVKENAKNCGFKDCPAVASKIIAELNSI